MELKQYQKQTLDDIEDYLIRYRNTDDPKAAFEDYWNSRGGSLKKPYNDSVSGVPRVCIKVPTGGGKTAIGVSAIRRFFGVFPRQEMAVIWLVPSDAIREQVIDSFSNPAHPYRQKLNSDFSARVEIVDVERALDGHIFNHSTLSSQLTVFVLSYDSLRTRNADNRRMYKQNGYLMGYGLSDRYDVSPVPGADINSVIVALNDLNPFVVLDESHNARSTLSKEMLANLNPKMILEMTATPRKDSNVITYVTASELKKNQMVKIPIILYGRYDKDDVLSTSIAIRNGLESRAKEEEKESGRYIRPIVLCQAQPKSDDDAVTFESIKNSLMDMGIPEEQIAIKVSDRNDIKGIDLLSRECEIRYIITVNALKEGWDCPFAYILATVADRKSPVDVQQIVGRVLRQPYAMRSRNPTLNESFIITCSENFSEAVRSVTESLKDEGFGRKTLEVEQTSLPTEPVEPEPAVPDDHAPDVPPMDDPSGNSKSKPARGPSDDEVDDMLDEAGKAEEESMKRANSEEETGEERRKEIEEGGGVTIQSNTSRIKDEFIEEIRNLVIPMFEIISIHKRKLNGKKVHERLRSAHLYSVEQGTIMIDMDPRVNFSQSGSSMVKADARGDDMQIEYVGRQGRLDFFVEFEGISKPDRSLHDQCVDLISRRLDTQKNHNRCLDSEEIREYVDKILKQCDSDTLMMISKNISSAAGVIQKKIDSQLEEFRKKTFMKLVQNSNRIVCGTERGYRFPDSFETFTRDTTIYDKSLYTIEDGVSGWEARLRQVLMECDSVVWWHRINHNRKEQEFYLNGYINHYPDFIVRLKNGAIVLIEGKGPQLDGKDSENKLELGRIWSMMAGRQFSYLMVFPDSDVRLENAVYLSELDDRLIDLGS